MGRSKGRLRVVVAALGVLLLLSTSAFSRVRVPKKIYLRFSEAYLDLKVKDLKLKLVAAGSVLSSCYGWRVVRTEPYIFHMKRLAWENFFWKVNTRRGVVYKVKGGEFGHPGGRRTPMEVKVEVIGKPKHPRRLYLHFSDAYMVVRPGRRPRILKDIRIFALGKAIGRGRGWKIRRLKPYLFHLKREAWRGYYWRIDTSRREVYRVEGGRFGQMGGTESKLNIGVDVVY